MPSVGEVRIDLQVTDYLRNYGYEKQVFAADEVFPVHKTGAEQGTYKTLGDELLNIHESDLVADEAETNRIDYAVGSDSYVCLERGLKMFVSDRQIKQAPNKLQPVQRAAVHGMHGLKLRNENRCVTLVAATGNNTTPANNWNVAAGTPVTDIGVAKAAYKVATYGIEPTHIVIPDHVADAMASNGTVTALISAAAALSQPMQILTTITGKQLPAYIMGMKVVVPTSRVNTAEPGAAVAIAHTWADDVYLTTVDTSGDNGGYMTQFRSLGYTVIKWRRMDPNGWWVRVVYQTVKKVTNARCIHRMIALLS